MWRRSWRSSTAPAAIIPASPAYFSFLANRRRVHQPALVPQPVQAALEAQRLEVRVEALAVVADLLDDVPGPLVVQAEHLAEVAGRAHEALHRRVGALLIDVLSRKTEL